jgi:hypothetical protein
MMSLKSNVIKLNLNSSLIKAKILKNLTLGNLLNFNTKNAYSSSQSASANRIEFGIFFDIDGVI